MFQNGSDERVIVRRLALLMSIVEPYQAHFGATLAFVSVPFDFQ